MARDPNITVSERVIRAARRWLAIEDADLGAAHQDEVLRRVGDLEDAVRAYEKARGMKPIKWRVPRRRPTENEGNTTDGGNG